MPRRRNRACSGAARAAGRALLLALALVPSAAGACHTVYPQLNPEGEPFRANGLHGLTPAVQPIRVAPRLDVPGTLPVAFSLAAGGDFIKVDVLPHRGRGGRAVAIHCGASACSRSSSCSSCTT